MSEIQGSKIRDALKSGVVGGGGALPTEAFSRLFQDPKFVAELRQRGIANPKSVLNAVVKGRGSLSSERARHVFDAVRSTLKSGVELESYGAVRMRSSLARVSPKSFVSHMQSQASDEGQSLESAKEALRAKLRLRRAMLSNVRSNAPLTQRLKTIRTLRKGEVVSEAQADRDRVRQQPASPTSPSAHSEAQPTAGYRDFTVPIGTGSSSVEGSGSDQALIAPNAGPDKTSLAESDQGPVKEPEDLEIG